MKTCKCGAALDWQLKKYGKCVWCEWDRTQEAKKQAAMAALKERLD